MAAVVLDVAKGTPADGRARREILQVEVDQTTHRPRVRVAGAPMIKGEEKFMRPMMMMMLDIISTEEL